MKKIYKTPEAKYNKVHGNYDMLWQAVGGSNGTGVGNGYAKDRGELDDIANDNDFWSTSK